MKELESLIILSWKDIEHEKWRLTNIIMHFFNAKNPSSVFQASCRINKEHNSFCPICTAFVAKVNCVADNGAWHGKGENWIIAPCISGKPGEQIVSALRESAQNVTSLYLFLMFVMVFWIFKKWNVTALTFLPDPVCYASSTCYETVSFGLLCFFRGRLLVLEISVKCRIWSKRWRKKLFL